MADVKAPTSASKDALAAIFGEGSQKANVSSEPPSGAQGEGTVDEPYDQGNAPKQEPPSDSQDKGTVDEPNNLGKAPPPVSSATLTNHTVPSSSETHQGSGLPQAEPNAEQIEAIKKSKSHLESVLGRKEEPKSSPPTVVGPEPTPKPTEQAAETNIDQRGRKEWPSTRAGQSERSVSPGTLDDGSHVLTSGDKGEGYQPQSKLGKLKGKVFGH